MNDTCAACGHEYRAHLFHTGHGWVKSGCHFAIHSGGERYKCSCVLFVPLGTYLEMTTNG